MNFFDFLNSINAFLNSSVLAIPAEIEEISRNIPLILSSVAALFNCFKMIFNPFPRSAVNPPGPKLNSGFFS